MTAKACIKSMRLRTLPLSLSGIIMGISLAWPESARDARVVVFLLLTTCLLQILSNLSNELGDSLQGTDTAERQGIRYSVMDGEMTIGQLRLLVWIAAALCLVSGALLIHCSFGTLLGLEPGVFLLLGLAAVIAAMRYTLGKNPYGYRAKGDYYVFVFFGLVSTVGSYYICSQDLAVYRALLPGCAIGFFSMGVLNVNNIRDMKTDAKTKDTIAIRLGGRKARIYQSILICAGWICMVATFVLLSRGWPCLVTLPLFGLHLRGVWTREDAALDPMLPLLVLSTFLTCLIFCFLSFLG